MSIDQDRPVVLVVAAELQGLKQVFAAEAHRYDARFYPTARQDELLQEFAEISGNGGAIAVVCGQVMKPHEQEWIDLKGEFPYRGKHDGHELAEEIACRALGRPSLVTIYSSRIPRSDFSALREVGPHKVVRVAGGNTNDVVGALDAFFASVSPSR